MSEQRVARDATRHAPAKGQGRSLHAFGCLAIGIVLPVLFLLLFDWANDVRYWAITTSLQTTDKSAREEVIRSLRGGGPEAAHALGRALRNHPDSRVREGAARALGEFDRHTIDSTSSPLAELQRAAVQDPDPRVRGAAKLALEKLDALPN